MTSNALGSSVFSKIIRGELPSYKIHEDERTVSILALHQVTPGHTLIIPKIEVDYFVDVPEPYYSAVFKTARIVSSAIHKATGCLRVGASIIGWDVPHFHFHLIPMHGHGDLDFKKARLLTKEEMLSLQKKISALLP